MPRRLECVASGFEFFQRYRTDNKIVARKCNEKDDIKWKIVGTDQCCKIPG